VLGSANPRLLRLELGNRGTVCAVVLTVTSKALVAESRKKVPPAVLCSAARFGQVGFELTGIKALLLINSRQQFLLVAPFGETSVNSLCEKPNQLAKQLECKVAKITAQSTAARIHFQLAIFAEGGRVDASLTLERREMGSGASADDRTIDDGKSDAKPTTGD
jgi:hypothetical protein